MKPVVLFRRITDSYEQPELAIAKKYFEVVESRVGLVDRFVVARYSAYPFFRELEHDIKIQGSRLINEFIQHFYIADFAYYLDVKHWTPKTYFSLEEVPKDENKDFVVKGRTKSKKEDFATLMFAHGYTAAANIACELMKDSAIFKQGIIVRDFVPLKVLEVGINGMPFSNEHRFFYYKGQRLTHFFYWTISDKVGEISQQGIDFADKMAAIISEHVPFFVIDVAEKAEGGWILIEVNDGISSGLPEEACDEMYGNLARFL